MNKHLKKLFIAAVFFIPVLATAQNRSPTVQDDLNATFLHLFSLLFTFSFWAVAIIYFIKVILDDRIKNKLIDKGAPDSIVEQLLKPALKNTRNEIIKWICILASSGLGLLLVDYFQPLGIHSLAIICLSLSVGFTIYLFVMKKADS